MSQPATAHPHWHLYQVKVCGLALLCLTPLCLPLPARAGQWTVSYSQALTESYLQPDYYDPSKTTSVQHAWQRLPVSSTDDNYSWYIGYHWDLSGNLDLAGSDAVLATITWQPDGGKTLLTDPPPAKLTLIETAHSWWGAFWNGSGPPAAADGQASDGLGDPMVFTVSPNSTSCFGTSSGQHLIQVDGSSGVVKIPCMLSAQNPTSAWSPCQYNPAYSPAYWSWSPDSINYTFNVVPGTAPKSILINRPENTGANIEADRKAYDYGTGEWTCSGDSRFDNGEFDNADAVGNLALGRVPGTLALSDEAWQEVPISGPWPPAETCFPSSSQSADWFRHWHWYAETPPPATPVGSATDSTYNIPDFKPSPMRPHVDWPYSRPSPPINVSTYEPHDLLDEMQSSSVPAPQTYRVNLNVTDTDWSNKHPEYDFDHHANFFITYHNANEIVQQLPTQTVPTSQNPWKLVKFNNGSQTMNVVIPGPVTNWAPTIYYELSHDTSVSADLPVKILGFNFNIGGSVGTGMNTGLNVQPTPRNVPAGWYGYVYERPILTRYPFLYHQYAPAGRMLNFDANGNDQPFLGFVDRNTGAYNSSGFVDGGFNIEMKIVWYPPAGYNHQIVTLQDPLPLDTDPYGPPQ